MIIFGRALVSKKEVFYETVNSNFWWSTSDTGVYIPLANSENSCLSNCANSEVSGQMGMQSVKLMPNKGKIKKISFSITKTNPEGIPNPQFNIISGKAIDYDCDSSVGSNSSSAEIVEAVTWTNLTEVNLSSELTQNSRAQFMVSIRIPRYFL